MTLTQDNHQTRPEIYFKQLPIVYEVLNGLFHPRCPDFHANEKIIILKQALSE